MDEAWNSRAGHPRPRCDGGERSAILLAHVPRRNGLAWAVRYAVFRSANPSGPLSIFHLPSQFTLLAVPPQDGHISAAYVVGGSHGSGPAVEPTHQGEADRVGRQGFTQLNYPPLLTDPLSCDLDESLSETPVACRNVPELKLEGEMS